MIEKIYPTRCGDIHYWITEDRSAARQTLVFLPGLTADHRLFDRQLAYFEPLADVLVWDAPAHAASYPFSLDFTLADKAKWLHEILEREKIAKPILVGQSMGGYVAQMYLQLFPHALSGFVSIDSAPLQKKYMTGIELWLIRHTETIYRAYPWKRLVRDGVRGCAESEYGRSLMAQIMHTYDPDPVRYCKLVSSGYRMLAEAIEADLPYAITCPAMLLCGDRDHAGSSKRYNKKWHEQTGLPLHWISGAGHNANTDAPDEVNRLIAAFMKTLSE